MCPQSETGFLHYLDVSVGEMVASHKTHMGRLSVLAQRPSSGVLALGHTTGTVSMWTPSERRPVLKLLTHNGAVRALAADHTDKCAYCQQPHTRCTTGWQNVPEPVALSMCFCASV